MRNKQRLAIGVALLLLCMPLRLYAQSSSSPNYRVDQTFFGSGGEINACSGSYCSRQSAGELGVGNTASNSYQAYAGFNTTDEPFLEFVVTGANIDLGYLSTTQATTATGTFYVRAWQAGSYAVRTESDPPTNTAGGGSQITPLSSPTTSSPGTEQFGINLRDNSSPDVGTDPQQVHSFSTGTVASGYNTVNNFKHVKGDIIAQSTSSSGTTIYTISYLFNISEITKSGQYRFNHILVATGTY